MIDQPTVSRPAPGPAVPTPGATSPLAGLVKKLGEPRNLVALFIGGFGIGLFLGVKVGGGLAQIETQIENRVVPVPCRECEEKDRASKARLAAKVDAERREMLADQVFRSPLDIPDTQPFDQMTVATPFDHQTIEAPRVFSPLDYPAADSSVPPDPDDA